MIPSENIFLPSRKCSANCRFYLTFTSKQLSGSVLRIVSIFFSTSFSLVQLLVGDVPRCRRIAISAGKRLISVSLLIAAHLFRGFPSGGRRRSLFFVSSLRLFPHFSSQSGHICLPSGITQPQIAQTSTGGEM